MNVRAPKSYKDLLTINGVPCSTFRDLSKKEDTILQQYSN